MSGATHFIEVWKCSLMGHVRNGWVSKVSCLDDHLRGTQSVGDETIAIFYIKAKNKSDDNRK